ncbi:hypothetical protein VHUM_03311 [Vanrija humicola]|uniref:DNA polymerase n=1 Tax=Vanrija humicola TaxID=5417 RepID=A0A7D8YXS9_VANHU|nr:hypothetical protein VHUM_03311 [Vanrija humicola]
MLPQPKRSFARLSPTPQPSSQAPHASSSPLIRSQRPIQVPSEIKAERTEIVAPPLPNGQATPALPKQTKPALTPTFVDPDVFGSTPITRSKKRSKKRATISTASDSGSTPATSTRSRKRVKISSAEDLASQDLPPRNPSQVIQSNSTTAETSVQSSGSKVGLSSTAWVFRDPPPSRRTIAHTMEENGVDSVEYQDPFYSNPADVPLRPKLFAGRVFNVKGNSVADLKDFQASIATPRPWLKSRRFLPATARHGWEYGPPPPSRREVLTYFGQDETRPTQALKRKSQLAAPTQKNKYGYKLSQKKPQREGRSMSVLCLEVFAPSRGQLLPDPEKDEIEAIFYCFQNDDEELIDSTIHPGYHAGYVIIDGPQTTSRRAKLDGIPVTYVESELDLVNWVIDTTREWDPDVLTGWELHNSSWGYVSARADKAFSMDLMNEISRMVGGGGFNRKDGYSAHHTSTFKVEGRHVLNIWRILRSEVTLNQYTFENVVFHVLHQRIPRYSAGNLTALWRSKTPGHTALVLRYMFQRVVIYAELLDSAEIVSKNAEFARVFGVDFDAVIFRGSQFKVESFIFRLAKPESFVMVSPSKQQVGLQNAPFATPLIAEPESKYYNHPIVVLDFQSLYPSVMIAYNICYSTCLGRVEKFKGTDKFGFTELKVADGMIELLKDYLTVTPNGMIFVKPAVRKSLLAKMLGEVLDTRVMVKNAMKGTKDKSLTQMLNARQLGLKLMANVTYGYTSATFSGRMPCIEIADSIVQTGRETLEKAQELIHSRADWNATVVYGDTDSLFISLPGRSKEQAFKIGHDIADTVTAMNPKPVKLKFEKVYMGSVLMAKKRYVGFKYEHPDETEPVFDAKGIETIRRDGFPAQQKMEEVCLKMLFRNQDLSEIKEFCRQEWTKILQGRVSPQDFIIAKEVRLGTYSEKGIPPPGAAVAYRRILKDPRDEPQYAERVPYVISNAEGRRLIDRARMPEEMLANRSLGIDAEYYIRNLLIPPLARIFNLVGADVEQWYDSMPRQKRAGKYGALGGMRIDSHFLSAHCLVCGGEGGEVCDECRESPTESAVTLLRAEHDAQARVLDLQRICASCSGTPAGERLLCDSVDCPVMYTRVAAKRDAQDASRARELVGQLDW